MGPLQATKQQRPILILGFYLIDQFLLRELCSSAVLGVVILSVRPSICPSHACFVTNPKNLTAIFYITRNSNHSSFLMPKSSAKFQWGHPQRGRQREVGRLKRRFSTNIPGTVIVSSTVNLRGKCHVDAKALPGGTSTNEGSGTN